MSTARWGRKWADVDEDDDEGLAHSPSSKGRFECPADANGIRMVMEYTERDGKTYKVTRKVKQTTAAKWINTAMIARKNMSLFGKPALAAQDEKTFKKEELSLIVRSEEVINIELTKKNTVSLSTKDEAEDKFFEESLANTESLFKEKKVWTDMNRDKQLERDVVAPPEEKPKELDLKEQMGNTAGTGRYVPPSLRGAGAAPAGGKAGGKGGDGAAGQVEASVRITNLSEEVRDGDLQDLFGQFGRLQRVYLAKDPNTGASKGFAFVTYYNKEDAQKAIEKLNGHGYDNLILQVQWAKPRA